MAGFLPFDQPFPIYWLQILNHLMKEKERETVKFFIDCYCHTIITAGLYRYFKLTFSYGHFLKNYT